MAILRASSKDNSGRKYSGGGPRPDHADFKKKEAAERQTEWSKLSPVRQLDALDVRLGKGVGAKKQRERLSQLIKAKQPAMGANIPPEMLDDAIKQMEEKGVDTSRIKAKDRRAAEQAKRHSR
jgi:hypothetical protein